MSLKFCLLFSIHYSNSVFLLRLPYIIFQGGMPRASYGDRHSISVVHGSQQTAFDFTSRVIDFFIIFSSEPAAGM